MTTLPGGLWKGDEPLASHGVLSFGGKGVELLEIDKKDRRVSHSCQGWRWDGRSQKHRGAASIRSPFFKDTNPRVSAAEHLGEPIALALRLPVRLRARAEEGSARVRPLRRVRTRERAWRRRPESGGLRHIRCGGCVPRGQRSTAGCRTRLLFQPAQRQQPPWEVWRT